MFKLFTFFLHRNVCIIPVMNIFQLCELFVYLQENLIPFCPDIPNKRFGHAFRKLQYALVLFIYWHGHSVMRGNMSYIADTCSLRSKTFLQIFDVSITDVSIVL